MITSLNSVQADPSDTRPAYSIFADWVWTAKRPIIRPFQRTGGDDERRRLAGEYGAAEFITKPVDFDFLKTQLRDLSDAADRLTPALPRMAASELCLAPTKGRL